MKKILIYCNFAIIMVLMPQWCFSQCHSKAKVETCASKLGDFKFLKAYEIDADKFKSGDKSIKKEFSYVFSKNTMYKLVLCDGSGEGNISLIATIFDTNRKLKGSSYDKKKKKKYSQIGYQCTATGIYYISFSYDGIQPPSDCSLCILGFKK